MTDTPLLPPNLTPAQRVELYIKLRDHKQGAKAELDKSLDRINAAMAQLETQLLQDLTDAGVDSMNTGLGVVFVKDQVSVTVNDKSGYFDWLQETQEWDTADIKANSKSIRERVEQGDDLPPGIKYSVHRTVGVQRR